MTPSFVRTAAIVSMVTSTGRIFDDTTALLSPSLLLWPGPLPSTDFRIGHSSALTCPFHEEVN